MIEIFRNDYRGAIGFLSTSQLISIFILVIGIALFVWADRNGKQETEGSKDEQAE